FCYPQVLLSPTQAFGDDIFFVYFNLPTQFEKEQKKKTGVGLHGYGRKGYELDSENYIEYPNNGLMDILIIKSRQVKSQWPESRRKLFSFWPLATDFKQ
ncbi:MAG: hypothetical protein Q7J12_07895, partial [Syntrophales bacterium]|nr:hypothetical protein [Syntrophales bacterium]